jgi:hypothetical protein
MGPLTKAKLAGKYQAGAFLSSEVNAMIMNLA